MPISCNYTKPAYQCGQPVWVVALICDKCEATGTLEVCDHHYHTIYVSDTIRLACEKCQGTVSYIAERLDHSEQSEVIN